MNKNPLSFLLLGIVIGLLLSVPIQRTFFSQNQTENNNQESVQEEDDADDANENSDDPESLQPTQEVPQSTNTVLIFFPKETQNGEQQNCSAVEAIIREVPQTETIGTAAINKLLEGPNQSELDEGYSTSIPEGTSLNLLTIENGVARADFNESLDENVAGSCRVQSIRAQITETLNQFPTINEVVISINGETETILQP